MCGIADRTSKCVNYPSPKLIVEIACSGTSIQRYRMSKLIVSCGRIGLKLKSRRTLP